MALEPITRKEKIIAGENLEPITRLEKFLKEYGGSGGGGSSDAVLYTPQTLTDAQKKQARENIDAASYFVINATPTSDLESATLDKTFAQIQEAINAGKNPVVLMNNRLYLPISGVDTDYVSFSSASADDRGANFRTLYVYPSQDPQLSLVVSAVLNPDKTMSQVSMDSDPTEDMEIATKQYVDNKECILKSTTPGSTKKFKITVDDSGNISATEVT